MPFLSATRSLVDSEDPSVDEFLAHPDFRTVSAFFLGWVLYCGLHCILYSHFFWNSLSRLFGRLARRDQADVERQPPNLDLEKFNANPNDRVFGAQTVPLYGRDILAFTLTLCFVFASLGFFGSLLTFGFNGGAACAFVVAWGGIASQAARIVGLLIIGLEMRELGIRSWEWILYCVGLLAATALIFATNALSTGTLRFVGQLGVFLCYQKRFLPTALAAWLIHIILDIYALLRVWTLTTPAFLNPRHRISGLKEIRVLKVASLLILDILTIVPAAVRTSLVAEFVPFSVGAIIVICVFNHTSSPTTGLTTTPASLIAASPRASIPVTPVSFRQSRLSTRTPDIIDIAPTKNPLQRPPPLHIPNHPYSFRAFTPSPRSIHEVERSRPGTALSVRSIDSRTAKSVKNAVVKVASRNAAVKPQLVTTPEKVSPITPEPEPEPAIADTPPAQLAEPPWRPGHNASGSRQIWPEQAQMGELLESAEQVPTTPAVNPRSRPTIKVTTSPSKESFSQQSNQSKSSGSSFLGSDIIRSTPRVADKSRRWSTSSYRSPSSIRSRDSLPTSSVARSSRERPYSDSTVARPTDEELSIVYELSSEGSSTRSASRMREGENRLTFGEAPDDPGPSLGEEPPGRTFDELLTAPRTRREFWVYPKPRPERRAIGIGSLNGPRPSSSSASGAGHR